MNLIVVIVGIKELLFVAVLLLWVNMIMDSMGVFAFVMEFLLLEFMKCKFFGCMVFFINKYMWCNIIGVFVY